MHQTYGSKTYQHGQAELPLHDAVRQWSRGLAGLAAPGFHVSVEEHHHGRYDQVSNDGGGLMN